MTTHPHPDLVLDRDHALHAAAVRLAADYAGIFDTETIERFLQTSYADLAARATVRNHLPLLAERFAAQRLHALALVEGLHTSPQPIVLFLCEHNAGRSQMALGFFTHYTNQAVGWSGGSEPGDRIYPAAIATMAERGIDIATEYPKPWTDEVVRAADVVITMGCGDACPIFPGKRYEAWDLPDPASFDAGGLRAVRDQIEQRVLNLIDELGITPMSGAGHTKH